MVLRTVTDGLHKIRTNCLQAQQCPEIITVIPVVALVPARASALPPPIDDRFMLSIPLHHRCQHWQVPLPGLCRVPAPHLLQDMSLNSNRRGRKKPIPGVLHRRAEPSFRTMVNFRAVTTERLFQHLFSPSRLLGIQRTHHPHTWHRETDNRFQSYGKQHPIPYHLTPYSHLDAKELARFALATTRRKSLYFTVRLIHFLLGFSHAALRSHPYSAFTFTDDVMSYSHGIFSFTILCITRGHRFIYAPSSFSLSFSGTKG
jgi:hypothetical protein